MSTHHREDANQHLRASASHAKNRDRWMRQVAWLGAWFVVIACPLNAQGILETVVGDGAGDRLGASMGAVGDFDGDGADDLIVGAPLDDNNGADSGSARLVSGFTGASLLSFDGDSAGDRFGAAVDGAGDVNMDGALDLIVGAPFDDNTGADTGSVRVFSGATGLPLFTVDGAATVTEFGRCVSAAGDMNLDGFDDLVVGQSLAGGIPGPLAVLISGMTGTPVGLLPAMVGAAESVDGAADFGANGSLDVVVGSDQNQIAVVNVAGTVVFAAVGDSAGDRFGASVAFAPDLNGDMAADLVVGAPDDDNGGADSGSARAFSGLTGTVLFTVNGSAAGDHFGEAVGATSDLDGDGTGDLIIGVPGWDDALIPDVGEVQVFRGATGVFLYAVSGSAAGDALGSSVTGLLHVNGDFKGDFAAGAPDDDTSGADAGRATIYTGTCASITGYGSGCAPIGLPVPDFNFTGCMSYGARTTFEYTNGSPSAPAFLFLGLTQAAVPLPGGCTFLLGGVLPSPIVFFTNPAGVAIIPIDVPDIPGTPYLPSKVYSQVLQPVMNGYVITLGRCKCIG